MGLGLLFQPRSAACAALASERIAESTKAIRFMMGLVLEGTMGFPQNATEKIKTAVTNKVNAMQVGMAGVHECVGRMEPQAAGPICGADVYNWLLCAANSGNMEPSISCRQEIRRVVTRPICPIRLCGAGRLCRSSRVHQSQARGGRLV